MSKPQTYPRRSKRDGKRMFLSTLALVIGLCGSGCGNEASVDHATAAVVSASNAVIIRASGFDDLDSALKSAGDTPSVVLVEQPVEGSDLTAGRNITIRVAQGGWINLNGKLTVEGRFEADRAQVFTGSGSIMFSSGQEVFPQWWGNDSAKTVQMATDSLPAGGVVSMGPYTYDFQGVAVMMKSSNVTYRGVKDSTVVASSVRQDFAFSNFEQADVEGISFEGISFKGGSEYGELSYPAARRTPLNPNALQSGIRIMAGGTPWSSAKSFRDLTVRGCSAIGLDHLPFIIFGVSGRVVFEDNFIKDSLDAGFVANEDLRVVNNRVHQSKDNGLSISRGNRDVLVSGNTITMSAYNGIFVSGYISPLFDSLPMTGPEDFMVTGNTVTGSGFMGISLAEAPKRGVISNNVIRDVYMGSSERVDRYKGVGIFVNGTTMPASMVRDSNNFRYVAVRTHTATAASRPGSGPDFMLYWQSVSMLPEWYAGRSYKVNDMVKGPDERFHICVAAHDSSYMNQPGQEKQGLWQNLDKYAYPWRDGVDYFSRNTESYAESIRIYGNTVENAERGGIYVRYANGIEISSNVIKNAGRFEIPVDGAAVPVTDSRFDTGMWSFGVFLGIGNEYKVSGIKLLDNIVSDTRLGDLRTRYPFVAIGVKELNMSGNSYINTVFAKELVRQ